MKKMETVKGYEYANKRICKFGIQKEDCRRCLFDSLCTPEDKAQDKNKGTSKNKNQHIAS